MKALWVILCIVLPYTIQCIQFSLSNEHSTRQYWSIENMKNANPVPLLKLNRVKQAAPIQDVTRELEPDKYDTYPYKTAGKLFMKINGKPNHCSASSIGNNIVITAGHCISPGDGKTIYTDIVFAPQYRDQNTPKGLWAAKKIFVTDEWFKDARFERDVAFLVVGKNEKNQTLDQVVDRLVPVFNYPRQNYKSIVLGYPYNYGDLKRMIISNGTISVSSDPMIPKTSKTHSLQSAGSSGGPWIITQKFLYGITSYEKPREPGYAFSPYFDSEIENLQTPQKWIVTPTYGTAPRLSGHCAIIWNKAMYVFGGEDYTATRCYNSVYRFDLSTHRWELLECKGHIPSERTKVSAVVYNDCMYILGGNRALNDRETNYHNFFKLNLKSLKWNILPYVPHQKHSAALWKDQIVSCIESNKKKVYVFDLVGNKWRYEEIYGNQIPDKGNEFSVAVYKDVLLYWDSLTQELFELDLKNWRWKLLDQVRGVLPSIRSGHAMVIHEDSLYVIGGTKGFDACTDICKFDIERKQWSQWPLRFQLRIHSAVVYRNTILVYGGKVAFGTVSSDILDISCYIIPISRLFSALEYQNFDDVTFLYK